MSINRIIAELTAAGYSVCRASDMEQKPEATAGVISGNVQTKETKMAAPWDEWSELLTEFETERAQVQQSVTEQEREIVTGLIWLNAELNHIGRSRAREIVSGAEAGTDAERQTIEEFRTLRQQAKDNGLTGSRLALVRSVCEYEIDQAFNRGH